MNDHGQPILVTVPQAAAMLSIGRSKIYQLFAEGEITPVHIGRAIRVPVGSVSAYARRLAAEAG
jgi:excisionase family DNA binding protein